MRIGMGYDIHRLETGRPLVLGGIAIAHDRGPVAHSDGDVLIHALIDALVGAAGLGDIGTYFPDTDVRYKNADSTQLLRAVMDLLYLRGWRVSNVDATILAQQPKLAPHIPAMRERLSFLLNVAVDAVNIKAGTNEGLDAVGRNEAIAAQAVALLERRR